MKLLSNSAYSLLGTALPTLVSIVTVPFFVMQIGPERYGALAIAWLVLGYFGAADFGIGRAITQRIAALGEWRGGEGRAAAADSVWSALFSMAGFGLAGALLLYVFANWYFAESFRAGDGLRAEMLAALWLLAACNPLVAVNGVLAGALMGCERFRLVSLSSAISNSALLLFPLAVAYLWRVDLFALILASFAARALGAAMLSAGVWQVILRGQPIAFSRGEFRRLANFGAWVMVTALIGPLMVYSDRFVIGAFLSAAAVAAYAIPFQIASRTLMVPAAISQALFPRFAAEEQTASQARCRDYAIFIGLVFAPLIIGLICLARPLLELWLGSAFDPRSVPVAQIVLAGFWTNAIANIPFAFIQARGNPRFAALLHLAELPVYLALLMALGSEFGLPGYAAAFALRCALDCFFLCRRAGAADRGVALRLLPTILLIGLALAAAGATQDWRIALFAAALLGTLSLLALRFAMPETIRARLRDLPILRRHAHMSHLVLGGADSR